MSVDERAPTPPSGGTQRLLATTAGLACLIAAAGAVEWIVHVQIRPPCYPGYVRLVDLAPALPFVSGFVAAASVPLFVRGRKAQPRRAARISSLAAAALLLLLAVASVVGGTASLLSDHGTYDRGCWTF